MDKILRTKDEIERHLLFPGEEQHIALYQNLVLKSAFQPIVKADGSVFAYEALMRVYDSNGDLVNNGDLIKHYRGHPVHLINIDRLARVIHLRNFSLSKLTTNLFINMMPVTILFCENEGLVDSILLPRIYELGLKPEQVFIEIIEHYTDDDIALERATRHLSQVGLNIVIDDFGIEGSSEQRARSVSPNVIKADSSLLAEYLKGHTQPLLNVFALCRELGASLIVEGVEDLRGYHAAISLGADYLQGFYVGLPQFKSATSQAVLKGCQEFNKSNFDQPN
ncbi:EAL domain-containing protein [Photobacterium sp. DNB23_23_1]|uniref:EAL domain-containing protein n=1 Tax=Photobacterium pectinilyticum TaxID=2906793 RepID=A0ABT1N3K1_9GAMM|nr:EAL domain-containing protein [Photobacterium sp. ZSDE20]MCQ1059299.1 EAL domain-containing protein [Photobacterium sp. ZSDE20]MDD1824740.1 EAL domain-containing protein [Photobacterium sp. ZSDE20]